MLSSRGLCDELITLPEESYRLCCVVVCDLKTSRMAAPYIYDISRLKVKQQALTRHISEVHALHIFSTEATPQICIYTDFIFGEKYTWVSTITYGAGTWCSKAKTVAKLNSTEMDFWRLLARISRKVKIKNNIIKQKMKVIRSLLDDVKTKQLQWYGHVQRMEEGRLPKEVINWRPLGRRKRGRPKLTWAEGIRGLMREKGLMEEVWNDRSNWRKKIIQLLIGR